MKTFFLSVLKVVLFVGLIVARVQLALVALGAGMAACGVLAVVVIVAQHIF